jgi:hypothetical protein
MSLNSQELEIIEGYPCRKPKNDITVIFSKRNLE